MKFSMVAVVSLSVLSAADAADLSVSIAEGRQPRLASSGGTDVYCVFGKGEDVFCARSTDGGATFLKAVKVATHPGLMLGKRRGPRVVASNSAVIVSAISSTSGDLVAWRSHDRGTSWGDATRINDVDRSCREGLHDLAARGDGTVAAVWLDLRNRGTQLWGSLSHDDGTTWEPNRLVYRSPGGSICECCHPTIVASGSTWSFLWRNSLDGNRDVYTAASRDGLGSVGEAQRLGKGAWALVACPMDGGDLALEQKGGWAVWRRDGTCYATDLNAPSHELMLGPGEQPVVASTAAGPAFAWISERPGDLMFQSAGSKVPESIAKSAIDPDLLSLPDGTVLCAFESIEDGKAIVRVSRSSSER